jgi:hypothetical protein
MIQHSLSGAAAGPASVERERPANIRRRTSVPRGREDGPVEDVTRIELREQLRADK